jgi:hypothetical protein
MEAATGHYLEVIGPHRGGPVQSVKLGGSVEVKP